MGVAPKVARKPPGPPPDAPAPPTIIPATRRHIQMRRRVRRSRHRFSSPRSAKTWPLQHEICITSHRRLRGRRELLRGAPGQGQAWARRLRQDRRLRHLRASRPRLYRDRPGLLEAHVPGHHPRVDPRTVINSDGWRGYHGLVDLGYGHFRVDHARDEFTKGAVHINGIFRWVSRSVEVFLPGRGAGRAVHTTCDSETRATGPTRSSSCARLRQRFRRRAGERHDHCRSAGRPGAVGPPRRVMRPGPRRQGASGPASIQCH